MTERAVKFPLFDSLRAIAVLAVLSFHVLGGVAGIGSESALRPYIAQLSVGVSIFFVISGFLLYRPFVAARVHGKQWIPTGVYAWRRFLRIVPPYWVALTLITIWLGTEGVFTSAGIPRFYGFMQIYSKWSALGGIPTAWSLCVEVVFYAFLPVFAFAMRALPARSRETRLRQEWAAVALLLAAGLGYNAVLSSQIDPGTYTPLYRVFPTFLDHFAVGMALAVASVAYEGRARQPAPLQVIDRFPGVAWAGALVAFWAVSTQVGIVDRAGALTQTQFMERRALYVIVAMCVVIPGVFGDPARGLVRKVLANRVMLYLGLISYSLFLYHVAVLTQIDRWGFSFFADANEYLKFFDVLIPSVIVASLSYYLVERPFLKLKRLFGPKPEPAPAEATAEPAPGAPLSATRAAG
jgi:peptidoglycan/LPS O-acetylase OafA/YrhL